jgi:hypothetical protein
MSLAYFCQMHYYSPGTRLGTVFAALSVAPALAQHAGEPLAFRAPGHGAAPDIRASELLLLTQIQTASSPPTKHQSPFQIICHWLPNTLPHRDGNPIRN